MGHYQPSSSEIAFPVARSRSMIWATLAAVFGLLCIELVTLLVIIPETGGDDDSNNDTITTTEAPMTPEQNLGLGAMGIGMVLWLLLCFYYGQGREWLIFSMKYDTSHDEIYIQSGRCMDKVWCITKKTKYDLSQFKGIRIQTKLDDDGLEDAKGGKVRFIMEYDESAPKRCCCGLCKDRKSWSRMDNGLMTYYELVKFFRNRYPERKDVHFSIPNALKVSLMDYGVNDRVLNESWRESEHVDLQIGRDDDDNNRDGDVVDLRVLNEFTDLIEFVKEKNPNDIIINNECEMVLRVLNRGNVTKEMLDYYIEARDEYAPLYPEMETLLVERDEYGQKILTLLAYKAKKYDVKDEGNEENTSLVKDTLMTSLLNRDEK